MAKGKGASKNTEEALKESQERWRSVVENAPNFICVVDRNGDIQYLNRTAPGVTMEEAIGSSTYDWVLPQYRALHKKLKKVAKKFFI